MVRLAPTDSRAVSSVLAVERALVWYLNEVPNADKPPVSAEQAQALRAALAGEQRWDPAQFEVLVTFSHAMYRLSRMSGEVPQCNLGDTLTALAQLDTAAPGTPRWTFEPAVDAQAFARLEFAETSAGIVKVQRENREGWWAHAQRNRGFIEEAARGAGQQHGLVLVLGAAHAYDLPLVELARAHDRVLLVDIDAASLEATVATVFKEPALRGRVECRTMDLTGINAAFVRAVDTVMDGGGGAAEVHGRLEELARSYRLPRPPRLLPEGTRADLVVSSCVLSQVAWPQRMYAQRLFEQRFGTIKGGEADRRWVAPWREFELRVQQDHVAALAEAAETVVLSSDMISHPTVLDAAGAERPTGNKIFPMGVESLRERIPRSLRIDRHDSWTWNRFRPVRGGKPGSRMDVEGVVLREPRSAGGLWLPEAG